RSSVGWCHACRASWSTTASTPGAGSASFPASPRRASVSCIGSAMASKEEILRAVRAHRPPPADLPEVSGHGVTYPDRLRQFAALLESVGGRCVFAADRADVNRALAALQ